MKGLEPSTFCMASRRSSQLSYIRTAAEDTWRSDQAAGSLRLPEVGYIRQPVEQSYFLQATVAIS